MQMHMQVYLILCILISVKRVFSQNSEPDRSPSKNGTSVLPRTKGRPVTTGGGRSNSRTVTRGASVNKRGKK
jgi:hypothetical protein